MKTLSLATIYGEVAEGFAGCGDFTPSHCDVRCAVNDCLDAYSRSGFRVRFDYSQDAAFRKVRAMLAEWRGNP